MGFDGKVLQAVIFETFQIRGTNLVKKTKIFSSSFYQDTSKITQWNAFINRLQNKNNIRLEPVLIRINEFVGPIYNVILE